MVACCIADILRIFAPEAPYRDPQQIKTIFYFLIKQLGGLKDPKDPAFKRYFYLLENLAYVKSFNMCFDLEDFNEIFCALFGLMFKIVNDEHSGKVCMALNRCLHSCFKLNICIVQCSRVVTRGNYKIIIIHVIRLKHSCWMFSVHLLRRQTM